MSSAHPGALHQANVFITINAFANPLIRTPLRSVMFAILTPDLVIAAGLIKDNLGLI